VFLLKPLLNASSIPTQINTKCLPSQLRGFAETAVAHAMPTFVGPEGHVYDLNQMTFHRVYRTYVTDMVDG
jgi:hypothetical protein